MGCVFIYLRFALVYCVNSVDFFVFWLRIGWLVTRGCLLFVFVGYAHGGLLVALRFDCVLK